MQASTQPRYFSPGGLVAALLSVLLFCAEAHAYNPFGRGDRDSTALINARKATGDLTAAEVAVILLADPPVSELSAKSIVIAYDPGRYGFRPELSGPVCEFAVGANCPPPSAQYGTFLVSSLPVIDLQIGSPLPGSVLDVQNDAINGVVSVSYQLAAPLIFATAGDRNWFAFYFESRTPYNPFQTLVTFYDTPGVYDFTQLSAGCVSSNGSCGSDIPGFGFSLAPVPEPASLAMWLAGVAALALGLKRRHGTIPSGN